MKKSLIILSILFAFSGHSQSISSLLDSINKYKLLSPQKALDFGIKALEKNAGESVSNDQLEINYNIGEILFYLKNYSKSLEYLTASLSIHELLPSSEKKYVYVNKPPWVLVALGNLYFKKNRNEKAKENYLEAIENFNLYEKEFTVEKLNGLNTAEGNLALIYVRLEDFEQAEYYYQKILERREKKETRSEIMFTYVLLMDLYFNYEKEGMGLYYFDLAKKLYLNGKGEIPNEEEIETWYSYTLTVYGSYLKRKKEYKEALNFFYDAKKTLRNSYLTLDHFPNLDLEIFECLYQLKSYKKAEEAILENLDFTKNDEIKIKKLNALTKVYEIQNKKNELIRIKDSIIKIYSELDDINFYNLENQLILSEKEKEINNKKIRNYQFIMIISLGSLLALLIIFSLIFKSKSQKEKNRELKLEKNEVSLKLESKNRELVSKANFILQRNEYLKNIISKLNKNEVNEQSFRRVKKEVSELINSEKSYEEFDKIFTNVYPKFYKVLNEKHNLSQTYLRLAAYIKMNQSNNEIAKISGISLRTVETQRYRLLKKLEIDQNIDLNTYIQNII